MLKVVHKSPKPLKPSPGKKTVDEFAKALREKWERRDRLAAGLSEYAKNENNDKNNA